MDQCPDGFKLLESFFDEGSLGVSLKWRASDGVVFVAGIQPNSQAMDKDICVEDTLWSVGPYVIGNKRLEKSDWDKFVEFIKGSQRPLKVVWKRSLDGNDNISDRNSSAINNDITNPETEATQQLKQIATRLYIKEPIGFIKSDNAIHEYLIQPTRKLIFMNLMTVDIKNNTSSTTTNSTSTTSTVGTSIWNAIWNTQKLKRVLILFNDLLMVTIPNTSNDGLQIEHIIGLLTLKLSILDHLGNTDNTSSISPKNFIMSTKNTSMTDDDRTSSLSSTNTTLEILWPNGILSIYCKAWDEKEFIHRTVLDTCTLHSGYDKSFHLISHAATSNSTTNNNNINNNNNISTSPQSVTSTSSNNNNTTNTTTTNNNNNNNNNINNSNNNSTTLLPTDTLHSLVLNKQELKIREYIRKLLVSNTLEEQIDETDDDGFTPLHYACIFKYYTIIQILYEANANIFYADLYHMTPLHYAAIQLDNTILDILLTKVIDPDIEDQRGRTPLLLACSAGLNGFGKYDYEDLKDVMDSLLHMRADPNKYDFKNQAVLHYIASQYKYDAIKTLIQNDGNIHIINNNNGYQALHYTVCGLPLFSSSTMTSSYEQMKKLKNSIYDHYTSNTSPEIRDSYMNQNDDSNSSSNTELDIENMDEKTLHKKLMSLPLLDGVQGLHTIRVLLQLGARPNAKTKDHKTVLQILIEHVSRWKTVHEVICLLIIYGARLHTEIMDTNVIHVIKERCKMELKILSELEDNTEEDDDRSPFDAYDNKNNTHNVTHGQPNDNDKEGNNWMFKVANDEISSLKKMTIDKAIDIWNRKADIQIDGLGIRTGMWENQDDTQSTTLCYPIDNKEKCVLCSAHFSLFRRHHRCRLCRIQCCDDCSKKRVLIHAKKERVCDSCYNKASSRLIEYQMTKQMNPTTTMTDMTASKTTDSSSNKPRKMWSSPKNKVKNPGKSNEIQGNKESPRDLDRPVNHPSNDDDENATSSSGGGGGGEYDSSDEEEDDDDHHHDNAYHDEEGSSSRYQDHNNYSNVSSNNTNSKGMNDSSQLKARSQSNVPENEVNDIKSRSYSQAGREKEGNTRNQLFGNITTSTIENTSSGQSKNVLEHVQADRQVNKTIHTMNEINERLKARGKKLSDMADKTEKLNHASSDFAKLAKQLKEQQQKKNSWF